MSGPSLGRCIDLLCHIIIKWILVSHEEFRTIGGRRRKYVESCVVSEEHLSLVFGIKQEKLDDVSPISTARHHPHCSPGFCRGCMEEQSAVQEGLPVPEGFLLHLMVTAMNGDADDEPTIGGMNCLRQDLWWCYADFNWQCIFVWNTVNMHFLHCNWSKCIIMQEKRVVNIGNVIQS